MSEFDPNRTWQLGKTGLLFWRRALKFVMAGAVATVAALLAVKIFQL
jgi:hypothetical protein